MGSARRQTASYDTNPLGCCFAASSNDESFCATPGEERSAHVSLVTPCHVSLVTTCHVSRVPNMFDLSSVCQITPRAPVMVLLLMSDRACRCIYLCFTLY